ncbi:YesL family protein [Bavariicoccus seileri]|uniref:YesL family protein n=1 Tax=Bavariicoccus seileri TaxID=549685 RepID=UPI0003B2ED3C|nr:YesL family protein [Bavariicoccus seileri]
MNAFFQVDGPVYRVLMKIWSLLVLNLCILVTSIPLVTIGVSISAAYATCFKLIDNNDTRIVQNYSEAFKRNFKQAIGFSVIHFLLFLIIVIDIRYFTQVAKTASFSLIGVVIVGLFMLLCGQFLYGYIARYQDSAKVIFINATKLCLANIWTSLVLAGMTVGVLFVMLTSPVLFVFMMYISIFIGLSFMIFLKSFLVLNVFKKYEKTKEI